MQHFCKKRDKLLLRNTDCGKSGFPHPSELTFKLTVDMALIFICLSLHGSNLRHFLPVAHNFFVFPLKENSTVFVLLISAAFPFKDIPFYFLIHYIRICYQQEV